MDDTTQNNIASPATAAVVVVVEDAHPCLLYGGRRMAKRSIMEQQVVDKPGKTRR